MPMYGRVMKDHNWHRGGYGKLTVTEILGVSSNVGTSYIIDHFYGSNPQKFVDGLKRMSIDQPLHLQIAEKENRIYADRKNVILQRQHCRG